MVITIPVVDHATVASSLNIPTLHMNRRCPKLSKHNIVSKLDRTPEQGSETIVDVNLNPLHLRRKVGYEFKSEVDGR